MCHFVIPNKLANNHLLFILTRNISAYIRESYGLKKILYILEKKCYEQNMKIIFRENVFVLEDCLPTLKKTLYAK